MNKAPFVEFQLSTATPAFLYWIVIKVGGVSCGYIVKNVDQDEKYFLAAFEAENPPVWTRRFIIQEYFDTVEECKTAFLAIPIGKILPVGQTNEN